VISLIGKQKREKKTLVSYDERANDCTNFVEANLFGLLLPALVFFRA
jgi:hypothetical protein